MTTAQTRKIVLVIASLGAGGAERVMSLLAGEWARRGNDVTLITLSGAKGDHFSLPAQVKRVALDVMRPSAGNMDAVRSNLNRMSRLRAVIRGEHPDVIISFMDATNVLTLMATAGLNISVIVSERIDPRHYPIARGWAWLRRHLYLKSSAVVVQTEAVAEWARDFVPEQKVHVIGNPVAQIDADPATVEAPGWLPSTPFVLAMGRLDPQKGFDLLLRSFARVAAMSHGVPLVILGEGPQRRELESLATELGLADLVIMPGRIDNPALIMARAKCFVLSSRFEGFPNALLEAMAAGRAVVSFDCPSGPGEIITNEHDGLLVKPGDVEALASAVTRVLNDDDLRENLGREARTSMAKYSLEHVTDQWEQLMVSPDS